MTPHRLFKIHTLEALDSAREIEFVGDCNGMWE